MVRAKASLFVGACGLLLGSAAAAQEAPGNASDGVIGPPQLRDFSIVPRERIVTQPPPQAQPPRTEAPAATPPRAAPAESRPRAATPTRTSPPPAQQQPAPPASAPATVAAPEPEPLPPAPELAAPTAEAPPAAEPLPEPLPQPAAEAPAATVEAEPGLSYWLLLIPALLFALGAFVLFRRRRAAAEEAPLAAAPAVAARPEPVADPAPAPARVERPWLELEFKAQRTALTDDEATVAFELEIANSGKAPAGNVRISARMFNAGVEQDKEIGSFFRSGSEERRTFTVPAIPPGERGIIRGTVHLKRDEVRPISVEGRALFVPMVAVNAFYDWGEGGSGQTARSYVVGRELAEKSEKMGPFRLDLGPRIWRTVGQRPHRLARRV